MIRKSANFLISILKHETSQAAPRIAAKSGRCKFNEMIALHKLSFAVFAGCCLLARDLAAQTYEGRELVKPQLLADTNTIVPGKPFTVGLLLHIAPHWHTYWKFSGDAGLPTRAVCAKLMPENANTKNIFTLGSLLHV